MKLRKQAPAKALIVAATLGLLAAFFSIIRSEPRIQAETNPQPETAGANYELFFAPGASGSTSPATHTRTHAS